MSDPWLDDGDVRVWLGDAREALRALPDESAQCIVTSPPFFGLRDYGTGRWEGGDAACEHVQRAGGVTGSTLGAASGGNDMSDAARLRSIERSNVPYRDVCGKCGAKRVDEQIGNEATPDEWVANLVLVFRECRRVLRRDGVLWIEVGDSYAEKSLVGAPWMLAFALKADGWFLRAENIWHKPNPMPESVTDRTTRAHSQVFMLSKTATYFYDADAIRDAHETADRVGERRSYAPGSASSYRMDGGHEAMEGSFAGLPLNPAGRNARSVWRLATASTKDAHFAVMPEELAAKCIAAGTSEHGACAECGAPWRRVVEKGEPELRAWSANGAAAYDDAEGGMVPRSLETGSTLKHVVPRTTTGWEPTCKHDGAAVVPQVVLDPFLGSGTTAWVARQMGRHAAGVELNEAYMRIAAARLAQQGLLT